MYIVKHSQVRSYLIRLDAYFQNIKFLEFFKQEKNYMIKNSKILIY